MNGNIRCVRCKGRKKLFMVNSIYTYTNTGGIEKECPMCLGAGFTKSLKEALGEVNKIENHTKPDKIKGKGKVKDLRNAEKEPEMPETA